MQWWTYFLALPVCALVYFLYIGGFAVSKRIRAVLFVFRRGKDTDKATIDSCTGVVKYIVKVRENRTYEFALDCQLANGDAEVSLLDRKKQRLLKLNSQCPTGKAELAGKSRYCLCWNFKSATGKCELHR